MQGRGSDATGSTLCLSIVLVLAPLAACGTSIRETHPNLISGELGGRAVVLSGNYERYLTDRVGIGVGGFGFGSGGGGVGVFPVYVSYIPVGNIHSLYLSAGATLVAGAENWDTIETAWLGTFSAGYQYQSEGGFFIRPTMNVLWGGGSFLVVPGVCIGGSF